AIGAAAFRYYGPTENPLSTRAVPASLTSHAPSREHPGRRRGARRQWTAIGAGCRRRSDPRRETDRAVSREDRSDRPDHPPTAARDAGGVLRSRHHPERRVLRPLSRLPDPDLDRSRLVAARNQGRSRPTARAVDERFADEVSEGVRDRGQPVL